MTWAIALSTLLCMSVGLAMWFVEGDARTAVLFFGAGAVLCAVSMRSTEGGEE